MGQPLALDRLQSRRAAVGTAPIEDSAGSVRLADLCLRGIVIGGVGVFFERAGFGTERLRRFCVKMLHRVRPPFDRLRGLVRLLARR